MEELKRASEIPEREAAERTGGCRLVPGRDDEMPKKEISERDNEMPERESDRMDDRGGPGKTEGIEANRPDLWNRKDYGAGTGGKYGADRTKRTGRRRE